MNPMTGKMYSHHVFGKAGDLPLNTMAYEAIETNSDPAT
jgi:hypothetical protein